VSIDADRGMEARMHADLSVTAKNDLAELARVSHLVEDFGARHALSPPLIFEVNLALDEVLTNVISYGYDDHGTHNITVRITLRARELVLEVEDDGRPFNPLEVRPPAVDQPVEQRPVGGLGVFLVRKMMDELEYRRVHGKNLLVMRKSTVGRDRAT
jgi:serine/threonine-protein kinase RsbW